MVHYCSTVTTSWVVFWWIHPHLLSLHHIKWEEARVQRNSSPIWAFKCSVWQKGRCQKNHPLVCSSNTCYQCEEHPPGSVIWCEAQQLLFLHFCLRFHLFLHTTLFFVTLSALFTISVTGTTGLTFIRITANLHHSFGSCRSVTSTILTICIWNKDINNRSLWNTSKSPNLQTKFCKY